MTGEELIQRLSACGADILENTHVVVELPDSGARERLSVTDVIIYLGKIVIETEP